MRSSEQRHAERQAVNAVIQGTAADIMKIVIARLSAKLPKDCRLLLTVHDSVLLEVPVQMVSEISELVRQEMVQPPDGFTVPIAVKLGSGQTWAECKQK